MFLQIYDFSLSGATFFTLQPLYRQQKTPNQSKTAKKSQPPISVFHKTIRKFIEMKMRATIADYCTK
jgi:hypothetical protein